MTALYDTELNGRVRRTAMTSRGGYCMSYILAEEAVSDELGEGRRTYSVFAAMCGEGGEADCATVHDLTASYELACEFFRLVTEGAVTPCTLTAVAEDFAASV